MNKGYFTYDLIHNNTNNNVAYVVRLSTDDDLDEDTFDRIFQIRDLAETDGVDLYISDDVFTKVYSILL